jgi:hypothetical protein
MGFSTGRRPALASAGKRTDHEASRRQEVALSEAEDKEPSGGRGILIPLAAMQAPVQQNSGPISFNRQEIKQILNLYGRKVADGEWRDYAIDLERERAVFSIFRRTSEMPLYRIVKQPKLARRQGVWSLVTATGLILKRGHDLANVLKALDRPLKIVA